MTIEKFYEKWSKVFSRRRWNSLTFEFEENRESSFGYATHVVQPKSNKLFIIVSTKEANYTDEPDGIKGTLIASVFNSWLETKGISQYGDFELVLRKDFEKDSYLEETVNGYYKVVDVQLDPQERNIIIKTER